MQKQTKPKPFGASMAKLFLVFAVIISLGAVAGVVGYLVKNKAVKIQQQQISPATEPEKSVEDETKDWKTYRNEEYGFELKYPEYWNNITVNENKDFLNKGTFVRFLFEDFPERNNPRFVGFHEGVDIRIYSKDYSCAPDEYGCAVFNCKENFEGETEHKRPADYGVSDYLMMFCKRIGNIKFLPAAITYKYFIEENETNKNIKNNITLQRIEEFKKLVDSFKEKDE